MHRNWKTIRASVALLCLMLCFSAFSQAGHHTHIRGTIVSRSGDTMVVKDSGGADTTVVVTSNTRLGGKKLRHRDASQAALIPGLWVKVEGDADEKNQVVAEEIHVGQEELETAEMIRTNLEPVQKQVAANTQKIAENSEQIAANQQKIAEHSEQIAANTKKLDEHSEQIAANSQQIAENQKQIAALTVRKGGEVQAKGTVNFETDSAKLSAEGKQELQNLAQKAAGIPGSQIEITGFTDSTGTAAYNDKLSRRRARAVMNYMVRELRVPRQSILVPAGMGESNPVASNDTTEGRAENRRSEIKVLGSGEFAGK